MTMDVPQPCCWCGRATIRLKVVEYSQRKGKKTIRLERSVPCCDTCAKILTLAPPKDEVKRQTAVEARKWKARWERLI